MVFVTSNWQAFKTYAENCRVGSIQQTATTDGEEIRVMTGRFGYKREFKFVNGEMKDQALLKEIIKFAEIHGFIPVEESVPDDQFHTA